MAGTTSATYAALTLSDGVSIASSTGFPAGLLSYSSSLPTAASVDSNGVVTLVGNSPRPVNINVTAASPSTAAASASIVCNLSPSLGDMDLGSASGLQFASARGLGEVFVVDVRVNVGNNSLGFLRFTISFPSTLTLLAALAPSDWPGGAFIAATGASGDISLAPVSPLSGVVTVAQLIFQVSNLQLAQATISGSVVALISHGRPDLGPAHAACHCGRTGRGADCGRLGRRRRSAASSQPGVCLAAVRGVQRGACRGRYQR